MIGFHCLQTVERIRMLAVPTSINYDWHAEAAVVFNADIQFFRDLNFFHYIDASAEESLLTGLRGHQYFPAHILRDFLDFFGGLANVDTSAEPCFFEISLLTASCLDLYIKQLFCLPRP